MSVGFRPRSPSASLKLMDMIKESEPEVGTNLISLKEISGTVGKFSGGEIQDPKIEISDIKTRYFLTLLMLL